MKSFIKDVYFVIVLTIVISLIILLEFIGMIFNAIGFISIKIAFLMNQPCNWFGKCLISFFFADDEDE